MGRLQQYKYFFSYYLQSHLHKKPLLGGMKLTHNCNLSCIHCPFWKREKDSLSFSQAVSALKTLYQWGVRIIIIEGGEPFLWKDGEYDLKDIVAEAKELFFSVGVTTNGTFPIEINSDIVWVSIDGLKTTHNRIRSDSFERVIANIKASSHPRIYAHITINSLNWKEIPELVEFLSSILWVGKSGFAKRRATIVKGITIQFHYPYEGEEDDLFLPFSKRRLVLDNLIRMKKDGFPLANSYACLSALKDNRWKCYPWMIASVEPDGNITHGCYVKNRGEVACQKCGFSAHTEISLAYSGVLESIRSGYKIFGQRN